MPADDIPDPKHVLFPLAIQNWPHNLAAEVKRIQKAIGIKSDDTFIRSQKRISRLTGLPVISDEVWRHIFVYTAWDNHWKNVYFEYGGYGQGLVISLHEDVARLKEVTHAYVFVPMDAAVARSTAYPSLKYTIKCRVMQGAGLESPIFYAADAKKAEKLNAELMEFIDEFFEGVHPLW
jgi:hypothetical protein